MDEQADSSFPDWPELRRLFTYDDLVGKVVGGRYRIVRRLGAGGMGVVFLAHHIHLDKPFALKIISPRFLDEPEISRRFLQEARAASRIDHPNVVTITDFGPPEEGPAFFAMEYLDGEDLAHLLRREGPLPAPRVLTITAQITRALAAAHQHGVVHRDIKPQNCLRVAREDNPDFIKVLDFGLAKVVSRTGSSAWTVGGSPGYIAPEIYRGGRTDHRVDIFAVGVVLHTLLLGRLPAQTPADVELPPGAPVLHLRDLPAPLQRLIAAATADDPDARPPTAAALLAAIEATRAELTAGHDLQDMSKTPSSLRRWLAPAALAAGLASIAALVAARTTVSGDMSQETSLKPAASSPSERSRPTPTTSGPSGPPRATDPTPPPPDPNALPPGSADGAPNALSPGSDPAPNDLSPGSANKAPSDLSPGSAAADPPAGAAAPDDAPGTARPLSPGTDDPARPTGRPAARQPFDEEAARALLLRQAAAVRACKASSTFRGVEATVRLAGTITVTERGRATLTLPPGYDVAPCLAKIVAGLQFRPSTEGGRFEYTFLL